MCEVSKLHVVTSQIALWYAIVVLQSVIERWQKSRYLIFWYCDHNHKTKHKTQKQRLYASIQQHNNTATQQHNNTATQQYNNTTTQQHNSTKPHNNTQHDHGGVVWFNPTGDVLCTSPVSASGWITYRHSGILGLKIGRLRINQYLCQLIITYVDCKLMLSQWSFRSVEPLHTRRGHVCSGSKRIFEVR